MPQQMHQPFINSVMASILFQLRCEDWMNEDEIEFAVNELYYHKVKTTRPVERIYIREGLRQLVKSAAVRSTSQQGVALYKLPDNA